MLFKIVVKKFPDEKTRIILRYEKGEISF